MRKKIFGLLVVMLLLAVCVYSAPVTINALFMKQAGYSEDDVTAGTKDFQKANPDVIVVLTFVPYEQLEEKIITSAQAGSYDVVLSDGPFTAKFAKAGIIKEVPAAGRVRSPTRCVFSPGGGRRAGMTRAGRLRVAPF